MSREDWTDTPTEPIMIPDLDDPVDPADTAGWHSRRTAAQPPLPAPVRAVDIRRPGPVIPRHGALGRVMTRGERRNA